jgi:Holliday junction resolvase
MVKVFEFSSISDLKQKVEGKDLYISIEIYNQIKKAFYSKNKVKKVIAFSAKIDNREIINFILERDQWKISLNTCLNVFIKNEMYEECSLIRDILKNL